MLDRRSYILERLAGGQTVSAAALAEALGVERETIWADIVQLREQGSCILSTPRGYRISTDEAGACQRVVTVRHDESRVREELYLVIDLGGWVLDVSIQHERLGLLAGELNLRSRYEADCFLEKSVDQFLLCDMNDGTHKHTIQCPDPGVMDRVLRALGAAGFLAESGAQ